MLTGGEITLRLDLVEIVEYARELGIVNLLSNASTLNADLVNKLKKLNIRSYSSTVFSMQPHVHDSITRVRGSYFSAIAGIKLLKMAEIPVEIKNDKKKLSAGLRKM